MLVKYLRDAAGVPVGTEKNIREEIAKQLIAMGVAEEIKSAPAKEIKVELETKEEKNISKRKTKSKK